MPVFSFHASEGQESTLTKVLVAKGISVLTSRFAIAGYSLSSSLALPLLQLSMHSHIVERERERESLCHSNCSSAGSVKAGWWEYGNAVFRRFRTEVGERLSGCFWHTDFPCRTKKKWCLSYCHSVHTVIACW